MYFICNIITISISLISAGDLTTYKVEVISLVLFFLFLFSQ